MSDALPRPDCPIALVGLMGAGKTSLGRRLARRLALPFVDADAEIEAEAGLAVAEIFERHGEAGFRAAERRTVARLAEGPAQVIATGGGAFLDPATRRLLLDRCLVVWLDADVETLVRRTARRDVRPLLRGGDAAARLRSLAAERAPIYSEAHLRVAAQGDDHDQAVERILAAIAGAAA